MKAVAIDRQGESARLRLVEVPSPEPKDHELLVAVHCAGLNRADLMRATSHYGHAGSNPEATIAGLELAGEVVAIGSKASRFKIGDRVMAMASRAYAENAVVDERLALRVPERLSWPEAAAISVSFLTAHDALISNGNLQQDDSVLVQATTSGAGIAAVQIAAAKGSRPITGTSGSPQKLKKLEELGLDIGIDVRSDDVVKLVQEATDGRGVDVIIDNIGKGVLQQNVDVAAIKGRIVQVGRMGGYVDEINLDDLARKRLRLIGVTFRSRTLEEHAEVVRRFEEDMFDLMAAGKIKPLIDRSFDLDEAEAAQDYMKSNQHLGKVVLRVA